MKDSKRVELMVCSEVAWMVYFSAEWWALMRVVSWDETMELTRAVK